MYGFIQEAARLSVFSSRHALGIYCAKVLFWGFSLNTFFYVAHADIHVASQNGFVFKSDSGAFVGTLLPMAEPIPLNTFHDWRLEFSRFPAGQSIAIRISGGMPGHTHGLPTIPIIENKSNNTFLIKGLKFHMSGNWFLSLGFESDQFKDFSTIQFEL